MKIILLVLSLAAVSGLHAQDPVQSQDEKTVHFNCYFNYNAAVWPKDSVAKLSAWLEPYLQKKGLRINLAAYTDTIGSTTRNHVLAEKRLDAVKNYFNVQKMDVKAIALGEYYDTEGYRNDKLYRKVEITLNYLEAAEPAEIASPIQERIEEFAKATAPISLNIQFVPGEDVYIDDSYLDVVALLQYLKQNPEKKAFIRGHVCCKNDIELSNRRAFAVYNDLLLEGISADRISYQGFGNTMPIVEELDEPSRQQNRRVDVIFSNK